MKPKNMRGEAAAKLSATATARMPAAYNVDTFPLSFLVASSGAGEAPAEDGAGRDVSIANV
jgi:hypothetical protein